MSLRACLSRGWAEEAVGLEIPPFHGRRFGRRISCSRLSPENLMKSAGFAFRGFRARLDSAAGVPRDEDESSGA